MTDGSNNLIYLDIDSLKNVKRFFDSDSALTNINEMEYIKGFIYANVYKANYIAKIDPNMG